MVHEAVTRACKEQHRQIEARFTLEKEFSYVIIIFKIFTARINSQFKEMF